MPNQPINWVRAFLEGLVIVGSILAAFGLQAWWDARGEQEREQRILEALLTEFDYNTTLLAGASGEYRLRYAQADSVLRMIDAGPTIGTDADFDRLVRSVMQNRTFHLEFGAHNALLSSGDMDIIQDPDLRAGLAAWPSHVAEWAEENEAIFTMIRHEMTPYLSARIHFRDLNMPLAAFLDGEPPPPLATRPNPQSLSTLRNDMGFENLVFLRAQATWYAIRDGETLMARLTEIKDRLQANLSS